MADGVKPSDSAQAPAGTPTGTPAATAAPAPDKSQIEVQRLQTQLGIETKRREEAQRAFHTSQARLKALESQATGYETPGDGNGTNGAEAEILRDMMQTYGLVRTAIEAPDYTTCAAKVSEVMAANPERYSDPNPYKNHRAAYLDVKAEAEAAERARLESENAELRKQLEARANARAGLAIQATSSGVQATEAHGEMTMEEFKAMSTEDKKKYLLQAGLMR